MKKNRIRNETNLSYRAFGLDARTRQNVLENSACAETNAKIKGLIVLT